jgi:hypothetical protein
MGKNLDELNEVSKEIINVLKSKIEIKSKSENFPNTNKIYSLSNVINFLNDKYSTLKICQAFDDINNCNELNIKYILVKNFYYNEKIPYYYLNNIIADEEAINIKSELERWSEENSRNYNLRKKETKKRLSKKIKKRKVSEKQLNALKKARESKKIKNEN